jgi:hypothetical protein
LFCGINIGHVLAYAPKSADGIWLDVAVREIIEEIASFELERAIQTGVYNKYPVVTHIPHLELRCDTRSVKPPAYRLISLGLTHENQRSRVWARV